MQTRLLTLENSWCKFWFSESVCLLKNLRLIWILPFNKISFFMSIFTFLSPSSIFLSPFLIYFSSLIREIVQDIATEDCEKLSDKPRFWCYEAKNLVFYYFSKLHIINFFELLYINSVVFTLFLKLFLNKILQKPREPGQSSIDLETLILIRPK